MRERKKRESERERERKYRRSDGVRMRERGKIERVIE